MSLKRIFSIKPPNPAIIEELQQKIDQKTKPLGALGRLERLALQIGQIQQTLEPELICPTVVVFAGDHGIVEERVSAFPQEVTQQMVANFLAGGAAVNVFARQHQMDLWIVDAGVNGDLPEHACLLNCKIAPGTQNFKRVPAMTPEQCEQAVSTGADIVQQIHAKGCNTIMFGEMGIGNTTPAAALLSVLAEISPKECTGRGTGLDDVELAHKVAVLSEAVAHHGRPVDPFAALTIFGGFEIAMMCGAFLQAAENRMTILVDGFIVTSALLVAAKLYPTVVDYCIFSHLSEEPGHQKMLDALNGDPLLKLDLRLGEGTGAILVYPLVESAVRFLNEMASFASAGVSEKS